MISSFQKPLANFSKISIRNGQRLSEVGRLLGHSAEDSSVVFADVHVEDFGSSGTDDGRVGEVVFVEFVVVVVSVVVGSFVGFDAEFFDDFGEGVSEFDDAEGGDDDYLLGHVLVLAGGSDSWGKRIWEFEGKESMMMIVL